MKRYLLLVAMVLVAMVVSAHEPAEQCRDAKPTPIKDIRANPDAFVGRWVLIEGEYEGWDFNKRLKEGPPVTRSDWVVYDGTGAMYVSSHRACARVKRSMPLIEQVGQKLTMCAKVAKSDRGQLYLECVEGAWLTLKQESQPQLKKEAPQPQKEGK
ncbi:MAG TPA: hypothetical protein ENF73_00100 [Proteobacteria bacterium]|nr:hypothetical protein [Pseudomonadota bacterium]